MTKEDEIERLKSIKSLVDKYDDVVALREAIKALEQEPCEDTVSLEAYKQALWERDIAIAQLKELGYGFGEKIKAEQETKTDVLDKIRAEIEPTRKMYLDMNDIDWLNGCDYVLSLIDKYKAEMESEE